MKSKQTVMCILALLTCALSGCNTRIGWPGAYSDHGFLALVVLGLIGLGILVLIASVGEGCRESLVAGVLFLLVAGLLLQVLPHTASGVQFVPLFPWQYDTSLARIISGACWLCIVFVCLCVFSNVKGDWPAAGGATLIVLGLNVLLSFAGPADAPQQPSSVITSFRENVAQCEKLKTARSEALEKLQADKETLVTRIKGLGRRTKRELMAHSIGRTLVSELEHLSRQIASLQREVEAIEAVLEQAQSVQRSVERQAMLNDHGLSDAEFARLSQIDHELQEEVRKISAPVPGAEVQMDKLLDCVLAPSEQGDREHD
jgi:hypothetical protein